MKRLYLGRTESYPVCKYELGTIKEDWNIRAGFVGKGYLIAFCLEPFEQFTNVKLKPGELMKVESINFKLAPIKKGKK